MTYDDYGMDAAWLGVVEARSRNSPAALARACNMLGSALALAGRPSEAACLHIEALQAAREAGQRDAMSRAASALTPLADDLRRERYRSSLQEAEAAYGHAADAFEELGLEEAAHSARTRQRQAGQEIRRRNEEELEAETRNIEMENAGPQVRNFDIATYEELAAGFVAIKLLGPFLQAFATKLGEQLGESAAQAIGRIQLSRRKGSSRILGVNTPSSRLMTRVELPEPGEFTDEARLALLDLDVTADGIQGELLQWDPAAGLWKAAKEPNDGSHPPATAPASLR
jgi:hypothetical protein